MAAYENILADAPWFLEVDQPVINIGNRGGSVYQLAELTNPVVPWEPRFYGTNPGVSIVSPTNQVNSDCDLSQAFTIEFVLPPGNFTSELGSTYGGAGMYGHRISMAGSMIRWGIGQDSAIGTFLFDRSVFPSYVTQHNCIALTWDPALGGGTGSLKGFINGIQMPMSGNWTGPNLPTLAIAAPLTFGITQLIAWASVPVYGLAFFNAALASARLATHINPIFQGSVAPTVLGATTTAPNTIVVTWSMPVSLTAFGSTPSAWSIAPPPEAGTVEVTGITLLSPTHVQLTTTDQSNGVNYQLGISTGAVESESGTDNISQFAMFVGQNAPLTVASHRLIDATDLSVVFSRAVQQATASLPANYVFNPSIQVLRADRVTDTQYIIRTVAMQPDTLYSVTVSGVRAFDGSLI